MATRTFAIGAGHMNTFEFFLWMAQIFGKGLDVIQLAIERGLAFLLVHRKLGKHPIQGLFVGHLFAQFEVDHHKTDLLAWRIGI